MTQPLDPNMLAIVMAAVEAHQLKARGGVKDMPFREVWEEFKRLKLSIAPGTKHARRDLTTTYSHEPVIIGDPLKDNAGNVTWPGLEFEWEGRMVRLGDVPSLTITPEMIARFVVVLATVPRRDGKEGPNSAGYRNRVVATIMSVLSWKWGKGRHGLIGYQKEDVSDAHREGYLTDEQVDKLCDYADADLADAIRVAQDFGCLRRGEVVMLTIHMIDWELGTVTLPGYMVKNDEERSFPLFPETMAILRRRKEAGRRGNPYLFQDPRAKSGLCPCEGRLKYPHDAGHLGMWWINDRMHSAVREANIMVGKGDKRRYALFHDVRRRAATDVADKTNGNVKAVMDFGGWKSMAVARRYMQKDVKQMAALRDQIVKDRAAGVASVTPPPAPAAPERKPPKARVPARKPMASAGRARRARR